MVHLDCVTAEATAFYKEWKNIQKLKKTVLQQLLSNWNYTKNVDN